MGSIVIRIFNRQSTREMGEEMANKKWNDQFINYQGYWRSLVFCVGEETSGWKKVVLILRSHLIQSSKIFHSLSLLCRSERRNSTLSFVWVVIIRVKMVRKEQRRRKKWENRRRFSISVSILSFLFLLPHSYRCRREREVFQSRLKWLHVCKVGKKLKVWTNFYLIWNC